MEFRNVNIFAYRGYLWDHAFPFPIQVQKNSARVTCLRKGNVMNICQIALNFFAKSQLES